MEERRRAGNPATAPSIAVRSGNSAPPSATSRLGAPSPVLSSPLACSLLLASPPTGQATPAALLYNTLGGMQSTQGVSSEPLKVFLQHRIKTIISKEWWDFVVNVNSMNSDHASLLYSIANLCPSFQNFLRNHDKELNYILQKRPQIKPRIFSGAERNTPASVVPTEKQLNQASCSAELDLILKKLYPNGCSITNNKPRTIGPIPKNKRNQLKKKEEKKESVATKDEAPDLTLAKLLRNDNSAVTVKCPASHNRSPDSPSLVKSNSSNENSEDGVKNRKIKKIKTLRKTKIMTFIHNSGTKRTKYLLERETPELKKEVIRKHKIKRCSVVLTRMSTKEIMEILRKPKSKSVIENSDIKNSQQSKVPGVSPISIKLNGSLSFCTVKSPSSNMPNTHNSSATSHENSTKENHCALGTMDKSNKSRSSSPEDKSNKSRPSSSEDKTPSPSEDTQKHPKLIMKLYPGHRNNSTSTTSADTAHIPESKTKLPISSQSISSSSPPSKDEAAEEVNGSCADSGQTQQPNRVAIKREATESPSFQPSPKMVKLLDKVPSSSPDNNQETGKPEENLKLITSSAVEDSNADEDGCASDGSRSATPFDYDCATPIVKSPVTVPDIKQEPESKSNRRHSETNSISSPVGSIFEREVENLQLSPTREKKLNQKENVGVVDKFKNKELTPDLKNVYQQGGIVPLGKKIPPSEKPNVEKCKSFLSLKDKKMKDTDDLISPLKEKNEQITGPCKTVTSPKAAIKIDKVLDAPCPNLATLLKLTNEPNQKGKKELVRSGASSPSDSLPKDNESVKNSTDGEKEPLTISSDENSCKELSDTTSLNETMDSDKSSLDDVVIIEPSASEIITIDDDEEDSEAMVDLDAETQIVPPVQIKVEPITGADSSLISGLGGESLNEVVAISTTGEITANYEPSPKHPKIQINVRDMLIDFQCEVCKTIFNSEEEYKRHFENNVPICTPNLQASWENHGVSMTN